MNSDDYRFLKIEDAEKSVNQKVSLIGIIVEFGLPIRSKGTDWFFSLKIVDETHHDRGLIVNIFAENQKKLPQVQASGDIIILSRVVMRTHKGETYALFNKSFSAFALYEGKYGQSCNPYQASDKFRQRDQDMSFVTGLRKWVDGVQLDTVAKESALLRQLKEGESIDLVCKILHMSEVNKDEWMLLVWDGSDAPPLKLQSELKNEMESPLPLHVESQPLPRDVLCNLPTVGTILRVFAIQKNVNFVVPSLTADRWVKFINLALSVHQGLWRGIMTRETKVRFVPDEDRYILELQRDYETRFSSKLERMPFASFPWPRLITDVDDKAQDVPLVTLMDILTYPQVTAKFKSIVRVAAALPSKVEDFRSPTGIYRVRLSLEDPTARIHAYVYAEDGEVFFGGYPPIDELTRKWNALLGVAEFDNSGKIEAAPRDPPWVVCCIKSYYIDESDVWGSRRFRIFYTKLVC